MLPGAFYPVHLCSISNWPAGRAVNISFNEQDKEVQHAYQHIHCQLGNRGKRKFILMPFKTAHAEKTQPSRGQPGATENAYSFPNRSLD